VSCFGVLWAADGQCPFNGVTDDAALALVWARTYTVFVIFYAG
jgi:hypothetical protein